MLSPKHKKLWLGFLHPGLPVKVILYVGAIVVEQIALDLRLPWIFRSGSKTIPILIGTSKVDMFIHLLPGNSYGLVRLLDTPAALADEIRVGLISVCGLENGNERTRVQPILEISQGSWPFLRISYFETPTAANSFK